MTLQQIEKRSSLTKDEFLSEYLLKKKPVVFTDLVKNWPATQKWTFDFLSKEYGDLQVPLHNNNSHKSGKNYMGSQSMKPFSEYLKMLQAGPTEYRMFLYNLLKHAPALKNDFELPNIMDGFLKNFAYLFFGGAGSFVYLHYDIDCSSVFLTQFTGTKKVILFAPDQSKYLYQHPYTAKSHVNLDQPNYQKYPALKYAEGFETIIEHGQTLYIPELYWHFITYLSSGFSLSLRANNSVTSKVRGLVNITKHFVVDKGMNKVLGEKWLNYKERIANEKAAVVL